METTNSWLSTEEDVSRRISNTLIHSPSKMLSSLRTSENSSILFSSQSWLISSLEDSRAEEKEDPEEILAVPGLVLDPGRVEEVQDPVQGVVDLAVQLMALSFPQLRTTILESTLVILKEDQTSGSLGKFFHRWDSNYLATSITLRKTCLWTLRTEPVKVLSNIMRVKNSPKSCTKWLRVEIISAKSEKTVGMVTSDQETLSGMG